MAGITKQTRSYMNQPIGVTTFDTGENDLWKSVANTASQLNQVALKEGAKQAEQSGIDAAMAIDQAQIIGFDAEIGKPKALDPKLFSGGIIARDAYKRVVERRFADSIESELKSKARELQLKYKFEPELFREEMSKYVADMHENAQGKWKETIKVGGVAITRAVELNIHEQKINLENEKLATNLNTRMNNFLEKDFFNNHDVYSFEEANIKNENHFNELIIEITDAEKAGIIKSGTAEVYKRNYKIAAGTHYLQNMLVRNFIPLDENNNKRNNLITAIKNRNKVSLPLNSPERDLYDRINLFTNGNKVLMNQIATNSVDMLNQVNQNSIENTENLAIKTEQISNEILNQSIITHNNLVYENNNSFISNVTNELETLKNLRITQDKLNGDVNVTAARKKKAEINHAQFEKSLFDSIVQKLIISTENSKTKENDILNIRAALKQTISLEELEKSKLNKFQKDTIKLVLNNNLQNDKNVASFFSNELDRVSRINSKELKAEKITGDKLLKTIHSELFGKTFEEAEKIVEGHLSKFNEGGSLSNLGRSLDGERYKANFTAGLIVRSLKEVNFSFGQDGMNEINAALTYINKSGIGDSLDNYPELKKHIDRTIKIGANPDALKPFLNHYKTIKSSEVATQKAKIKQDETNVKFLAGQSDASTKKLSENIINNQLSKYGKDISFGDVFKNPLGLDQYPELFGTMGEILELNQNPPQFEGVVNNFLFNRYSIAEAPAILNKLMVLNNKQDLETGKPMNLLQNSLSKEQFSQILFISNLSKTAGLQGVKEFNELYTTMQSDPTFNKKYQDEIGPTGDWLAANGFKEAANDISSQAFIEPYLKLSFFRSQKPEDLIKDVQEIFDTIYVETIDGVVTDGALGGERSMAAFSKVFPNMKVRNAVYEAIENELPSNSTLGTRGYKISETVSKEISGPKGQLLVTKGEREYTVNNQDLREFTLLPIVRGDNDYIYVVYEKTNLGLEIYRKETFDEFGDSTKKTIAFGNNEPYVMDKRAEVYSKLNTLKQKEINLIAQTKEEMQKSSTSLMPTVPEMITGVAKTPELIDFYMGDFDEYIGETIINMFNFMNKKRTFPSLLGDNNDN